MVTGQPSAYVLDHCAFFIGQERSPGRCLGNFVLQNLKQFAYIVLQILKRSKFETVHGIKLIDTLILDQSISRWETGVTFCGGLSPKPMFGAVTVCIDVLCIYVLGPDLYIRCPFDWFIYMFKGTLHSKLTL